MPGAPPLMKSDIVQKNKSFFVYMIFNELHKISYVGYTININNRLKAHNTNKGAKFTRGKLWKLIYFRKFKSKILAMKFEYKLKKDRILRKKITSKFLHNQ